MVSYISGAICFFLVFMVLVGGFHMGVGKSVWVSALLLFVLPVVLAVICSFIF